MIEYNKQMEKYTFIISVKEYKKSITLKIFDIS